MHAGVPIQRLHAGNRAHASQKLLEERDSALTIRIPLLRKRTRIVNTGRF